MDETFSHIMQNSNTIQNEILRFENVHPSIYALYELVQSVNNPELQAQLRDHVINIEESFVNSQEWTLGRNVPEIRLEEIDFMRKFQPNPQVLEQCKNIAITSHRDLHPLVFDTPLEKFYLRNEHSALLKEFRCLLN